MVKFENITKKYGNVNAVKQMNLKVNNGEFLSLVGPSGCGKTTTLRLIAGFIKPDEGKIFINNEMVNNVAVKKRNIGIVFQNYALFPNLNLFENIAFGLKARKVDPKTINKEVDKLIEIVGLRGKEKSFPKELSGGQQQRVALARSLAIKPKILLLDEPLSALDAKVRLFLRYEIKRIQREFNITTIYVTHDQEEALSISDRVAVMKDGTIQQLGEAMDIYNHPINKFVADFVGISSFLNGEYVGKGKMKVNSNIIQINHIPNKKINSEITVAIRPEKIEIEEIIKDFSSKIKENILEVSIKGITFLGSMMRVLVITQDNLEFLVDLPAARFSWKGGEKAYIYPSSIPDPIRDGHGLHLCKRPSVYINGKCSYKCKKYGKCICLWKIITYIGNLRIDSKRQDIYTYSGKCKCCTICSHRYCKKKY